jgi:ABC-type sugar transport system substrate-binding protein
VRNTTVREGTVPGNDLTSTNLGVSRRRLLEMGAGVAVSGTLLAACGGDDDDDGSGGGRPGDGKTIGVSLNGLVPYTQCVTTGVYKALEGTAYEVVVLEAQFQTAKELANIENLVNQGVDAIVIQPNTVESATRGARVASERGIPCSNCLWPGPGEGDRYFAGVVELPNEEGGRLIGQWLVDNVPGGGEIILVTGVLGQGFSERLNKGLTEIVEGTDGELRIVAQQPGNFDRKTAIDVVQNALEANPNANMIVDYAAVMGNGIAQFLQGQNRDDVTHVTSDADDEMLKWIKTPYLKATRYYSSAETGRIATQIVREALEQDIDRVEPFAQKVPQEMRTGENIDRPPPFCYEEFLERVKSI